MAALLALGGLYVLSSAICLLSRCCYWRCVMKAWAEIAINALFCFLCFGVWNTATYFAVDIIAVAKEIIVLLLT